MCCNLAQIDRISTEAISYTLPSTGRKSKGGYELSFLQKKFISGVYLFASQRRVRDNIAARTVPDMIFPNKQRCYIILYTTLH